MGQVGRVTCRARFPAYRFVRFFASTLCLFCVVRLLQPERPGPPAGGGTLRPPPRRGAAGVYMIGWSGSAPLAGGVNISPDVYGVISSFFIMRICSP
ncbi:hypothetical protein BH23ACI1_BH23ACI1_32960 [soil metagenome]